MKLGDRDRIAGCFTQEKFIAGRTLVQIEQLLGFQPGRLSAGGVVFALLELPDTSQFDVSGYSNVATHRFAMPSGLNPEVLKKNARQQWSLKGPDRLVKVRPEIGHDRGLDPDKQYPPGRGVPQWVVKKPLEAEVTAILSNYPLGIYFPVRG
jgi:hypothetical protein